jgi:hypothetical protein
VLLMMGCRVLHVMNRVATKRGMYDSSNSIFASCIFHIECDDRQQWLTDMMPSISRAVVLSRMPTDACVTAAHPRQSLAFNKFIYTGLPQLTA